MSVRQDRLSQTAPPIRLSSMQARITPGGTKEIGLVNSAFARLAGRFSGSGPPNIFTTLGRRRGLFRAWLLYSATMMPFGRLPRRETELVILRIAHLRGCDYEWKHHERLARAAGVRDREITAVTLEDLSSWEPRRYALLLTATQFVRQRDLDETAWTQLREQFEDDEIVELLMLCGQYDSLATTLLTLRVQPDHAPTQ